MRLETAHLETTPPPIASSDRPTRSGGAAPVASSLPHPKPQTPRYVVMTGNPNSGKTTLFNALTGMRAKVANYAGVTVERKEGRLLQAPLELDARVLDLPGSYSLSAQSLDEQVACDVLLNRLPELPAPAVVVLVVDASNLQRNLYYTTQVIELGYPTLAALNMMDVAEENGHEIDIAHLEKELGIPVIPIVASEGKGIAELRRRIVSAVQNPPLTTRRFFCKAPPLLQREADDLESLLTRSSPVRSVRAPAEALLLLTSEKALASSAGIIPEAVRGAVLEARRRLDQAGVDWRGAVIEGRYACVTDIQAAVTREHFPPGTETFSDKLDRVVTHKVWGTLIFLGIMALMFQGIFTFARLPMELLQAGTTWFGGLVGSLIPPGDLHSLLVDGIIAGVGAVVVFLPQILTLFLLIGFLEDTGYMARAAFLMDRLMSKVGLHGKSFIPMLSSFACAIPGIMATRTIESPKDRLVTILIAPLMSCSARLPVYTLLIGACIPNRRVLGIFKLQGLTMLGMYLLGIVGALCMAWVFKRTLIKSEPPLLIMELPPYKRPLARVMARHMWDRGRLFLRRAGTVILGINILLWFVATYPRSSTLEQQFAARRAALMAGGATSAAGAIPTGRPSSTAEAGAKGDATALTRESLKPSSQERQITQLDHELARERLFSSFAGRLGRVLEPVILPLGFDWKIGIGILSSFAAREVFVSTMAIVYAVDAERGQDSKMENLIKTLHDQKRPDGTPLYDALTSLSLMVFYVFALQCFSTMVVVRREAGSWKWAVFQWLYMGCLAWGMSFLVYQGGRLLFGN